MNLIINNVGTTTNPFYKIMDGKKEFCSTKNIEVAVLIQKTFFNIDDVQKIKRPSLPEILQKIKELKKVDLSKDFSQYTEILFLRYIYCRIARDNNYSLGVIGLEINRDHSSVIPALRKFEDYFETNRNFRELYFEILNSL